MYINFKKLVFFIFVLLISVHSAYTVNSEFNRYETEGLVVLKYRTGSVLEKLDKPTEVFSNSRFVFWSYHPVFLGQENTDLFYLFSGPYAKVEVSNWGFMNYSMIVGLSIDTLLGYAGNSKDIDLDEEEKDDFYWGSYIGISPSLTWIPKDNINVYFSYNPIYRFYSPGEDTELNIPENHFSHNLDLGIAHILGYKNKIRNYLTYSTKINKKEYKWGYENKECIEKFSELLVYRFFSDVTLGKVKLNSKSSLYIPRNREVKFGHDMVIYPEVTEKELRGYPENSIDSYSAFLGNVSASFKLTSFLQLGIGYDLLLYQAKDTDNIFSKGASGIGSTIRYTLKDKNFLEMEINYGFGNDVISDNWQWRLFFNYIFI
ncbi:MAG: hypothetical protein ACOC56_03965 [Atribacterota bacterium]